jgi:hypothetical protein
MLSDSLVVASGWLDSLDLHNSRMALLECNTMMRYRFTVQYQNICVNNLNDSVDTSATIHCV